MSRLLWVSILVVLGFSGLVQQRVSSDGQMFHANLAHTGVYQTKPALEGKLLWRFKADGQIRSSPVVAGGVVYIADMDANVYALK